MEGESLSHLLIESETGLETGTPVDVGVIARTDARNMRHEDAAALSA